MPADFMLAMSVLSDLDSYDIKSSYPTEIVNSDFPVSKFTMLKNVDQNKLEDLIYTKHKAVLFRCVLQNVTLKDDLVPVPYIPTSKCRGIYNGAYDNGRVLSAEVIGEITLTDIDYRIIKDQYDFDITILDCASARYGKLPKQLRDVVMEYFKAKTDLQDKPTDAEHTAAFYKLLYDKMKNLLNAQYGMMAQDPVKPSIKYVNSVEDLYEPEDTAAEILLNDHNKHAFLNYAWGCWVTCRAREHLQAGIDLAGNQFVYCDTDSVKYVGTLDWSKLNEPMKKTAKKNHTFAVASDGTEVYMGLFEQEKHIKRFKTMGAKKYAYIDMEDKLHITIAGVNKRIGAIELERAAKKHDVKIGPPVDPLMMMDEGFVFKFAGGLEARYSDQPKTEEYITPDGVPIRITRNVSLVDNTKTLGLTGEYRELLQKCKRMNIDI